VGGLVLCASLSSETLCKEWMGSCDGTAGQGNPRIKRWTALFDKFTTNHSKSREELLDSWESSWSFASSTAAGADEELGDDDVDLMDALT